MIIESRSGRSSAAGEKVQAATANPAARPAAATMTVPLLDLRPQLRELGPEIKRAVEEVIDSTAYIMGPKLEALEHAIAQYTQTRFAVGVSSGTDALLAALMALDVGPGDIVLTSAFSFFATAGVISRLRATPAFVDIDLPTFNLCPRSLAEWFERHPREASKVKAIVPVHLFGQCADMDPILSLAGQRDIAVIEDAAQALGATYVSPGAVRQCGSMGLCGCFSFFPSKNLGGVGDGGIIVTNDESFAEKLRMLRNHGAKPKYYHSVVGGNFRLDPIQAAVLLVKLPQLNAWHEARRRNAARYDAALGDTTFVTPVAVQGRVHHIYNQYTIRVEGRRDELKTFLGERGVSTEIYYPLAFHEQECFRYLGYRPGDFPNCERAARAALSLPVYPGLSEAQQDYVVENLKRFHG